MILNDLNLETSCRFKLFKPDRQLYNLSNINLELPSRFKLFNSGRELNDLNNLKNSIFKYLEGGPRSLRGD